MQTHNTREVGDNLVVGTNTILVIMVKHHHKDYIHVMFMKALIAVYLVVMVGLVRRQINQMQEEEEGVKVVMADIRGKTDIRIVDGLKKVFM